MSPRRGSPHPLLSIRNRCLILETTYEDRKPQRPVPAYAAGFYFAEKQIVKALPKMMKKTDSPELGKAFESHLAETEEQVTRLEQIFEMLGEKPKATKCPAIEGIIEEANELIADIQDVSQKNLTLSFQLSPFSLDLWLSGFPSRTGLIFTLSLPRRSLLSWRSTFWNVRRKVSKRSESSMGKERVFK